MGVKGVLAAGRVGVAAGLVARSSVRARRGTDADARHPEALFKDKSDGWVRAVFQP
jgi:hypothetical protein